MTEGRITLVAGSSGSAKTAWTLDRVATVERLLVWDPEGEFACKPDIRLVGYKELVRVARSSGPGRFAFIPPKGSADFDFWARNAWCYAQSQGEKTIVADETSDVTHSGKASGAWGQIIRRGRKHGANVIGITQRPAESDKTILGNASLIHICSLWEANDREYMSRRCGVPLDMIEGLTADKDTGIFEFIDVDRFKKTKRKGRLTFPGVEWLDNEDEKEMPPKR